VLRVALLTARGAEAAVPRSRSGWGWTANNVAGAAYRLWQIEGEAVFLTAAIDAWGRVLAHGGLPEDTLASAGVRRATALLDLHQHTGDPRPLTEAEAMIGELAGGAEPEGEVAEVARRLERLTAGS
jgi:rhamnogalacturonyl hydrolase YesR